MVSLNDCCFLPNRNFLDLQAVGTLMPSTVKSYAFYVYLSHTVLEHSEAKLRYELCMLHHHQNQQDWCIAPPVCDKK